MSSTDERTLENHSATDWSKCAICQGNKNESLQCPAECTRQSDVGAGYLTLSENLARFEDLGCLPDDINLCRLNESGEGIEKTLSKNKARWHKSCFSRLSTTKLRRAEKRALQSEHPVGGKFMRSARVRSSQSIESCFICEESASQTKSLHRVSTLGLDARVRECAKVLGDEKLLAKVSEGDLVALEACYHASCLAALYKREKSFRQKAQEDNITSRPESIALAELITYMEEQSMTTNSEELPVFRLDDLANLYTSRIAQFGDGSVQTRVNTTRLKERILCQVPDLRAYKQGRHVFLAFRDDIGASLQRAHTSYDEDAIHLAKAAGIIRKDMQSVKNSFNGSFDQNCQVTSVPESLVSLINMVLYGPNIESQASNLNSQASLSISQLIQYNSCIRRREGNTKRQRHNKDRETPLPLYVGLSIHAKTRNRDLIQSLHSLGLCVSYDRVLSISTELGNAACRCFHEENVVCPLNLRLGLFTTAAIDNIDHNPSSTTARDSFHGTGISMFQHATSDMPGTLRRRLDISQARTASNTLAELPESYTQVMPVVLQDNVPVSESYSKQQTTSSEEEENVSDPVIEDKPWLDNVNAISKHSTEDIPNDVSWAAYHSTKEQHIASMTAISALLPLFPDDSKTGGMVRHTMDIIKASVHYLNPGQIPVIAMDQPLYAIAKQIQWKWQDLYGEDKIVIMFGGLHIEMAFLKLIGGWLEGSGWTAALVDANIASAGTAQSFLKASSVTRTRRAHQVTASSLYVLLQNAHTKYLESLSEGSDGLSFVDWCIQQKSVKPQFYYWYTTMKLELLLLLFLKSVRQSNFTQYVDSISKMLPWFFSMNHPNYARWLSVHVQDMRLQHHTAPEVFSKFNDGLFTVHKSTRNFSSIAIDQAHEQNNAMVKGDGGAVGLTENPNALRRWMMSGPEIARLVNEFESDLNPSASHQTPVTNHHEVQNSFQESFLKDVKALVATMEELGNPFLEESEELIALDTRVIPGNEAVTNLRQIKAIGQEQSKSFTSECLIKRTKSLYEPIKRNKVYLFNTPAPKTSKTSQQIASLKSDCSLFSRLYISCQTRGGDLDEFFELENQACPPALSHFGKLRIPTKKSELAECLENNSNVQTTMPTDVKVIIIDGAAIVNMIKPRLEKTFAEYASESFLPYVVTQTRHAERVDIVWDDYFEKSLKANTRCNRGAGVRRRVTAANKLPRSWQEFLRVDENKRELFLFLAECISSISTDKQIVTTYGQEVRSTIPHDTSNISPCSHEEADTRMILHLADAVQEGYRNILVRTVDTDVLVLVIAVFHMLQGEETLKLWVSFGTGRHHRYIAAHEIASSLGPLRSKALPFFHAFTGCDTTSCFAGRGKKTAMDTWKLYDEVTDAFTSLSSSPSQVTDASLRLLERLVILMYDRTSDRVNINEARKQLFTQRGRSLEMIPPTRGALIQHTKRAAYQAGHVWGQATISNPQLPNPQEWGWTLTNNVWEPYWTTLPDATKSCRELIRCGCKKGCNARCSCVKASLRCTALCNCSNCSNA